ncbi:MAG: hypothetical protein KAI16_02170, partial [Candidatus Pacebacteria bacterium]|nr:hypothetical protein [Candidatus Paceibacterota bacterium]
MARNSTFYKEKIKMIEEKENFETNNGAQVSDLFGNKVQDLPQAGDNVEGSVIVNEKNTLYVDLGVLGTGII